MNVIRVNLNYWDFKIVDDYWQLSLQRLWGIELGFIGVLRDIRNVL